MGSPWCTATYVILGKPWRASLIDVWWDIGHQAPKKIGCLEAHPMRVTKLQKKTLCQINKWREKAAKYPKIQVAKVTRGKSRQLSRSLLLSPSKALIWREIGRVSFFFCSNHCHARYRLSRPTSIDCGNNVTSHNYYGWHTHLQTKGGMQRLSQHRAEWLKVKKKIAPLKRSRKNKHWTKKKSRNIIASKGKKKNKYARMHGPSSSFPLRPPTLGGERERG